MDDDDGDDGFDGYFDINPLSTFPRSKTQSGPLRISISLANVIASPLNVARMGGNPQGRSRSVAGTVFGTKAAC